MSDWACVICNPRARNLYICRKTDRCKAVDDWRKRYWRLHQSGEHKNVPLNATVMALPATARGPFLVARYVDYCARYAKRAMRMGDQDWVASMRRENDEQCAHIYSIAPQPTRDLTRAGWLDDQ